MFTSWITLAGCGEIKQYSDPGATITVSAEEQFVIALESNPSTGYSWQMVEPLDEKVVEFVSSTFEASKTKLIGAPGKELFTFRAAGKGSTKISFTYQRPWEKGVPFIKKLEFNITVN
jgi:inhibitor of cysteine peptidase